MIRTAFVIPWFGRDLVGGAERHIFEVTTRLARRGHCVEVLTTCCRSFQDDWSRNHFDEGTAKESDVVVRRFRVRRRDARAFDDANRRLVELNERDKPVSVRPVPEVAERAFVDENIHSPRLVSFVERHRKDYDSIVFVPYLYGPTLLGLQRAGDRAVLQPLLHDESYAYLPTVEALFHDARLLLFNSDGEASLAARLYGPTIWRKSVVTGQGIQELSSISLVASEQEPAPDALRPYLFYLGRRDPTKNTHLLLRAFRRYRQAHPQAKLKLVLAGPGQVAPEDVNAPGVVDLGLVSELEKARLLAGCRSLVQPSRNESYSRTVMEAWLYGRPVVVHEECLATSRAVQLSRGGWTAVNEEGWANRFEEIESSTDSSLRERGEAGRAYAREHADWDKAVERYERALDLRPSGRTRSFRARQNQGAIHQLLPGINYGDAISNQAVFTMGVLRSLGYRSEIFARHIGESMGEVAKPFAPGNITPQDGILYHHSIGTEMTSHAVRHPGAKALIYHNITPARFFASWDEQFARLLENGRRDLQQLAGAFSISAGVSAYNRDELRAAGFQAPSVVPIFVEPLNWKSPADPEWMRTLQDGRTNILFVGRVAPNKCQHHLLEAFKEYLGFDPRARLVLVGAWPPGHRYARFLHDEIERLGIGPGVMMTSQVSEAQLLACYRTAQLFWSMSEHEGFCVPLIEAMWFDVPVLAYRSSAIPETLGEAGMMFTEKGPWPELAALAHLLVTDRDLREKVLEAQRKRRSAFLPDAVLPSLLDLLARLGVKSP